MNPMLNIAIRAARAAATVMMRQLERVKDLAVTQKNANDYVTMVDQQAERVIIETLHKSYPDHAILAEESGGQGGSDSNPFLWIIDPLDGTTNYIHGFPQFAISIALQRHGKLEQAVVYDPLREELFTASRGGGALLNNRRLRVSEHNRLQGALLGIGFPFRHPELLDDYLAAFKALAQMTGDVRRAGAAALDLAYVACGRLDGFWEWQLKPWDIAAGALLVEEAGGLISTPEGDQNYLDSGDVVAANPGIHQKLLDKIVSRSGSSD